MTETTIKKYIPFGEPIKPETAQGGFGFIPNGIREKNIFFYHPDHLGSSSYITGQDGKVSQHTEYIAFGEILFDEHNTEHTMPYLFNGKELDQETNLTYFGARYLDMKTSLWLNTDPLSGYNPIQETEHYIDGQHNGGIYNPMNMATYSYTYQNPIKYIDPNGKQVEWKKAWESVKQGVKDFVSNPLVLDALTDGGYSRGLREIEYAKTNPSTMEWAAFQAGENAREIKSEFLGGYGVGGIKNTRINLSKGGAHGKFNNLYDSNGKLLTNKNHLPTIKSYKLEGFKISDYMGGANIMTISDHKNFISTGSSKAAIAFRDAEAQLLKSGKFIEAFDLNANAIRKQFGNKYDNALKEAKEHYQNKVIPILRKQYNK